MSAVDLLKKAVQYDSCGRRMEALKLYECGIAELLKICKEENDSIRKRHYQKKIEEYMTQAEHLKKIVRNLSNRGELCDKIHIVEGSTGFSYEQIFGNYLNTEIKEIYIEEPYLREYYQLCNLVIFCELVVSKCVNLKYINVTTVKDVRPNNNNNNNYNEQTTALNSLIENLKTTKNITLNIEYSENMHDRQIIFSNGYIIKIGRGLNYFKPTQNKFCLGLTNYSFRECKETNIDIFFCTENKK